jgi:hypothetical protein
MKFKLLLIAFLFIGVSAKSQDIPLSQLKDSAKCYYFKVFDIMNDKTAWTMDKFDFVLKRFSYYRKAVLTRIKKEKDKQAFHNWLVAEARAAGKINNPSN